MTPLLWFLVGMIVVVAILGGVTLSPFLLLLLALAIVVVAYAMRGGTTAAGRRY